MNLTVLEDVLLSGVGVIEKHQIGEVHSECPAEHRLAYTIEYNLFRVATGSGTSDTCDCSSIAVLQNLYSRKTPSLNLDGIVVAG
jgi:hypothetical protein